MSNATVTEMPLDGICFKVDGSDYEYLTPDRYIDGKWCFDMAKVKKALDIDYFEIVCIPDTEFILVCDEEALLKSEPIRNNLATILAGIPIYGNVLYCHTSAIN